MAELVPYPFDRLIRRMFHELEREQKIFDLPSKKFVRGSAERDFSVMFHGRRAGSPLGPAAGPQSQLAQNIVLSFLGGGRILELKTVQIQDRLKIPRPCIDAQTIGYNVEWSQELTLEQSLEEYVKASMLVKMLVASKKLGLAPGFEDVIFDMSVGYDLAGIKTERVMAFIHGMLDASAVIERLRREIPEEFKAFRDLDFEPRLSDTLTLSTFHGCPPDEIERIMNYLLEEVGLHSIVKLNPTLLGKDEVRRLLGELGYSEVAPDDAFDKDTTWEQALAFTERLGEKAQKLGRGFGVKFSNTLIVENRRSFFPSTEKVMYLSGQPLHVLTMNLVDRFRRVFGDRYPISFSAGIDAKNFPDAVSLGLVPVTVCTDLLRTGGYARMEAYFRELSSRMDAVQAKTIDEFVTRGQGQTEAKSLSEARLDNTRAYVARLSKDPRYSRAATNKPPKKVGSLLVLFDCLTCDKCIPVCPNDANFGYALPNMTVPIQKATPKPEGGFFVETAGEIRIEQKHQIGNFADFCNECGNCDVFCPEDGGPYLLKPRFFGSREQWELHTGRDGFFVEQNGERTAVLGRFDGKGFSAVFERDRAHYAGDGFELDCSAEDPTRDLTGRANGTVDLTYLRLMALMKQVLIDTHEINYVNV